MRTGLDNKIEHFYSLVNVPEKKKRRCLKCGVMVKTASNASRYCKVCRKVIESLKLGEIGRESGAL
jgi:formamidopyrimidine-DNA glycosylase